MTNWANSSLIVARFVLLLLNSLATSFVIRDIQASTIDSLELSGILAAFVVFYFMRLYFWVQRILNPGYEYLSYYCSECAFRKSETGINSCNKSNVEIGRYGEFVRRCKLKWVASNARHFVVDSS